jgi:uncharacterized protein
MLETRLLAFSQGARHAAAVAAICCLAWTSIVARAAPLAADGAPALELAAGGASGMVAPNHPAARAAPAASAVDALPAHMPFYVATRGTQTIYLLGTLHVGDPADYPPDQPFRPVVMAALQAAPTLALELSPDAMVASQQEVSHEGVCARACLPRMLPAPLWQRLRRRLRGNPPALAAVRDMRPWLASLVVESYDTQLAGLQSEYGTEAQLQNVYLRKRGSTMIGLETLDEQLRAFTTLTPAEAREMLTQDLAQTPAQNAADVRAMHRLWRIGDADALAAWATAKTERLTHDKRASMAVDEQILYARNRRFTARMIEQAAPGKPLFVAIGALHLGGRRGVIELLREQSFRVDAR